MAIPSNSDLLQQTRQRFLRFASGRYLAGRCLGCYDFPHRAMSRGRPVFHWRPDQMNEIHFLSIAGLLIALIDFFNLSRGVNRYLKQLNKKFAAALVSGVDPNEGGIHFLDVGSLFMLILITNLVNAVVLFIDISIDNYSGQGLLHLIAGFLVFLLIATLFSVLCTYVVTIVFGIWQSYMNYYLDFRTQPGLMKAWLILISPLAILFFPLVLLLVLMVVVNYGLVSLFVHLLSLPKKGIMGSLGLLIAISPFFV